MKRLFAALAVSAALATPAWSALPVGAAAPSFDVQATKGGQVYPFSLSRHLRDGPVVVYFFPAAFTQGCTIEAHEFAAAMDDFEAQHASVIGLTAGNTERLAEFSVSECRSRFPVAAATPEQIRAYDAVLAIRPNLSDRTSYVIAPDGHVIFALTSMNPVEHVQQTLAAVRTWRAQHPAH
jgi:peroxiredoxin